MKYQDFRSPLQVTTQMRSDFGWEKSSQIAYVHFK